MRIELWALQDQDRLLEEARLRLPHKTRGASAADTRRLLEVVHRAFIARLSGGELHPDTVRELGERHGAAALVSAAQGLAAALRERAARSIPEREAAELQQARLAITRALDDLLALFDDGAQLDIEITEPRPTVVSALQELAARPPTAEAPQVQSLLRVRATTLAAARALESGRPAVLAATGLALQPSAPDELLLGTTEAGADGVLRLVRAAGQVAAQLGERASELKSAVVVIAEDPLSAMVRAAALPSKNGLLFLDEAAWACAGDQLVPAADAARAVDPEAAFGHDRWELSTLLQRPPFLGRDHEIAELAQLLRGSGVASTLVLVHGAAGVGKASLVRAALTEAGLNDDAAAIVWGAADLHEHTPYAPLVAGLRALAGAPAGHPRAPERVARLIDLLATSLPREEAGELHRLSPTLHRLLGFEDEAAGDPSAERSADEPSPRVLRSAVRRALLLLLMALRARAGDGRPVVLVVSGADALDDASRDALGFVATRLGDGVRVVLLSATRLRLPASFEGCFRVSPIELRGLAVAPARELVAALFDRTPDDDELTPLVERARGLPLALLQLARLAVELGMVARTGERWTLGTIVAQRLPGRLERALAARMERLPADARRLLATCARLGPSIAPAAAEFVGVRLGMSRDQVARALALLVDAGFLARQQVRSGAPLAPLPDTEPPTLVFEHPLLRQAALTLAGGAEAGHVAGVAADALEATATTGMRTLAPLLARLHLLAGRRGPALHHLGAAVRRSVRFDDHHGAIAMGHEALTLAGDDGGAAFPFLLELETVRRGGPRAQQRDALARLESAADRTGDPRHRALAAVRAARFALFCGDEEAAEAAARAALAALAGQVDARLQPQALRLLALARFRRRDLDEAAACVEGARRATTPSDVRGLAALDHLAGLMALERGQPAAAVELLLCARQHRRAAADVEGECACLDAIVDAFARTGRLSTSLALLEVVDRLRESVGDGLGRAYSKRSGAEALLAVGDAAAALAMAQEARRLASAHRLDRLDVAAAVLSARAQLALGEAARADAELDGVRRRARDPFSAMEVAAWSARARVARARELSGAARERAVRGALTRAREAARLGEQHGYLSGQVLGMATIGEATLLDGDAGQALTWSQRAAELLDERAATSLPVEEVLSAWADALAALGDDEEAEGVRRRARALLHERAARLPEAARALFWSTPARRALEATATSGAR
ncbi:MAG: AAA family ATPase [Deltaproteobacteria bacterium]|nr:AAA family ATPase [Deltaproteobacteria bacterium]